MPSTLRPAPPIRFALTALAAGSLWLHGCGGDAKTPAAAAADSQAADMAADSSAIDAQAQDTQPADTQSIDSTGDGLVDGDADAAAASPAETACAGYAATICAATSTCCGGTTPAGCADSWVKACLKLGWADADDALLAKQLQQDDAAKSACSQALQAATQACDRGAASRALSLCLRSWVDPAKVGQPCAAPVELSCAAGTGRCTAKTTDLYQCTQSVGEGASCSLAQPCQPGLECLDSGLTRAKTCGKPGSTCNLADKCWDGWQCDGGSCKPGTAAVPASCAKDEECPTTHACSGGKCSPKLCK